MSYISLIFLFFSKPLSITWDSAEYLAYGKYIFGGFGFNAYYRPIVFPLLLGALWKINLRMPLAMEIFSAVMYLLIPLIPYFLLEGNEKFLGLLIASHPLIFKWSHYPLSHIPAIFFLILAYSTRGYISGVISAISGISRFTFLLFPVFHAFGSKKRFIGALALFSIYFFFTFLFLHDPFAQIRKAREVIKQGEFYEIWSKDPFFYIKILVLTSPLLFLGFFTLSKFSIPSFILLLFYSFLVPRKEDRFLIDLIPFLSISLKNYKKIILLTIFLNLLQLPSTNVYSEDFSYLNLIEEKSVVLGMHPAVNAYKDVYFVPWFDYFVDFNFSGDYCIYYEKAIPCTNELCRRKVEQFLKNCTSWNVIYNKNNEIIIARNPTPHLYEEQG